MVGEGSGTVYEARNSAGERVALKCLKPQVATSRRKRFKDEIRFCERIQHPNIVAVIDNGAATIGKETVSFYVMPYYSMTLRSLIEQGIAPDAGLRLFSLTLNGVEAAHLSDVHHRDLKPENILYDEGSENLVVPDFGAAEFLEDELYTIVDTKPNERIGNFQHAAPEQRSRGGKVDHRSDIYALGLILNEMYTGEVPAGSDYRLIASVSAQRGYLDGLVDMMRRQFADGRPNSIADVKR